MIMTFSRNGCVVSDNAIFYRWGYNGKIYELEKLIDKIVKDLKKNKFKKITVHSKGFNDAGKNEFLEGFLSTVTEAYSFDDDCKASTPWCAPWAGDPNWSFEDYEEPFMVNTVGDHPNNIGRAWAALNAEEIEWCFSNEEGDF